VPKLLCARPPEDVEERKVRQLAASRHAPGDWITRARIVSLSWQGLRTAGIAEELGCHPKAVRKRVHRFNALGVDGLADRPGAGRKPRITQEERSRVISLVSKHPPGRLVRHDGLPPEARDETKAAYRTLDSLAEAAQEEMGIEVGRSQVRRILLAEGVRWRRTRPWAQSPDPEFVPKDPGSSSSTPTHRPAPRWSASTSSAPLPGGLPEDERIGVQKDGAGATAPRRHAAALHLPAQRAVGVAPVALNSCGRNAFPRNALNRPTDERPRVSRCPAARSDLLFARLLPFRITRPKPSSNS